MVVVGGNSPLTNPYSFFEKLLSISICKIAQVRNTQSHFIFMWFTFQFRPYVQCSHSVFMSSKLIGNVLMAVNSVVEVGRKYDIVRVVTLKQLRILKSPEPFIVCFSYIILLEKKLKCEASTWQELPYIVFNLISNNLFSKNCTSALLRISYSIISF